MKVSIRTASRLPEIRVDDMGGHNRCFVPGGRSLVSEGMPGVTNTSHFRGMPRGPCEERDIRRQASTASRAASRFW
jgi:hypothetical protein